MLKKIDVENRTVNMIHSNNTQIPHSVAWFIRIAFDKELDRKICAEILGNLPLPIRHKNQTKIITSLCPTRPGHYWRVRRKLITAGIIVIDKAYDNRKLLKCYVLSQDLIKKLEFLVNGFVKINNLSKAQIDEKLEAKVFE